MPKVALTKFPVSALFGVVKPSGPTSMSVVNDVQLLVARSKLFAEADKLAKIKDKKIDRRRGKHGRESVKIGQGGTLDPLADGVLGKTRKRAVVHCGKLNFRSVIGVGKGTKKLNDFLNCTKVNYFAFITTKHLNIHNLQTGIRDNLSARMRNRHL